MAVYFLKFYFARLMNLLVNLRKGPPPSGPLVPGVYPRHWQKGRADVHTTAITPQYTAVGVRALLYDLLPRKTKGGVRAPPPETKTISAIATTNEPFSGVHVQHRSTVSGKERVHCPRPSGRSHTHIFESCAPLRSPCGYPFSMPGLTFKESYEEVLSKP